MFDLYVLYIFGQLRMLLVNAVLFVDARMKQIIDGLSLAQVKSLPCIKTIDVL